MVRPISSPHWRLHCSRLAGRLRRFPPSAGSNEPVGGVSNERLAQRAAASPPSQQSGPVRHIRGDPQPCAAHARQRGRCDPAEASGRMRQARMHGDRDSLRPVERWADQRPCLGADHAGPLSRLCRRDHGASGRSHFAIRARRGPDDGGPRYRQASGGEDRVARPAHRHAQGSERQDARRSVGDREGIEQVQGDIESSAAQRDYLRTITDTVRIDISYDGRSVVVAGYDFSPIKRAAAGAVQTLIASAASVITFLAAAVPWLPVILLVIWGIRRMFRRWRAQRALPEAGGVTGTSSCESAWWSGRNDRSTIFAQDQINALAVRERPARKVASALARPDRTKLRPAM